MLSQDHACFLLILNVKCLPIVTAVRLYCDLCDEAWGLWRMGRRRRRVDDPLRPRATVDIIDLKRRKCRKLFKNPANVFIVKHALKYVQSAMKTKPPSRISHFLYYWCCPHNFYRKDTEPSYHSFMCSLVSLLSSIYPFLAMHSLLVTIMLRDISKERRDYWSRPSRHLAVRFNWLVRSKVHEVSAHTIMVFSNFKSG